LTAVLANTIFDGMPSISVRKLDEKTVAALRSRAARHGVSMEEEVRRIIEAAVADEEGLGTMMERIFEPTWDGERLEIPPRDNPVKPIEFK